jgi:hypothetical protein
MRTLAFPTKYVSAYPANDDPRAAIVDVVSIMTEILSSDAHFSAYVADMPRRIGVALFKEAEHVAKIADVNLRMVLAVFDVDAPGHEVTEEWKDAEAEKLATFLEVHPGAFLYETRGGYRIVFALPAEVPLRCQADDDAWTAQYESWCRYLKRRFGIVADAACSDWTRLFRAPFVTRDGVPQRPETLGDPNALGVWAPPLARADRVKPRPAAEVHGAVDPVPVEDPRSDYGRRRIEAAVRYLVAAPLSIEGQGGRNTFFKVACYLVRRLRMPIDVAADCVEAVYNQRLIEAGTTPWGRDELEERLASAATTASVVPPGDILNEATWTELRAVLGAEVGT